MFYDKSKILHKFNPFCMPLIQFFLSSYELQSLVIAIQDKLLWDKIVPPFLQSLNYGIKLLVICGVFPLSLIQLLAEIGNGSIVLTQNCSYCNSTCVTSYLKCLPKIRQEQNWSFCYLLLQYIKSPFGLLCPFKILVPLLHCIHHGCTNPTEVSNELSIKTC
jgi:hypothetical protein